jgi:predicted AAA+ superfamily ATPase
MKRLFSKTIGDWQAKGMKKPLMVLGARQVGKTYIIDEYCREHFKHYHRVNLFETDWLQQLYSRSLSAEAKFKQLELLVGANMESPDTVLFVDEVQESEEFISALKFIQENRPKANVICAGSLLGVKLKRMSSSFPVGKIQMGNMYAMGFEEFLTAAGYESYIPIIRECYGSDEAMLPSVHEELLAMYRAYLCTGGMPEAVAQYTEGGNSLLKLDRTFFGDLRTAYMDDMKKYVPNTSESLRIGRLYETVPAQQANASRKFQYSKIKPGARRAEYETALDWLTSAGLVYECHAISNAEKPLAYYSEPDTFKLFLHDAGLLTDSLGIDYRDLMQDAPGRAKGYLAENYVAAEFAASGMELRYWRSGNTAEVDFVIENRDGVIPVEVKAADNVRAKSLGVFAGKYKPPYSIRVSSKNFGFANGIKSVPLYAAFLTGKLPCKKPK